MVGAEPEPKNVFVAAAKAFELSFTWNRKASSRVEPLSGFGVTVKMQLLNVLSGRTKKNRAGRWLGAKLKGKKRRVSENRDALVGMSRGQRYNLFTWKNCGAAVEEISF